MDEQQNLTGTIFIRCAPDLRDALEKLATTDQRSLSNYVRVVLEGHVREADAGAKKSQKKVA